MWWVCNTFHTNSTQKTHTKNKETIFNLIEQLSSWLRWLRICLQGGRPGFDPWVGRSSGEETGNPLQYSCLEFHGQRSLVAYNPWGCKESDMTEWLTHTSWKVQQYQLQDLCCYTGFWTSWARNKDSALLCCIQFCTVRHTKAQPPVEDACVWPCMPDMGTSVAEWTCKHIRIFDCL